MHKIQAFFTICMASILLGACQPRFYRMAYHPEPNLTQQKAIHSSHTPEELNPIDFSSQVVVKVSPPALPEYLPTAIPLNKNPFQASREKPKAKKKNSSTPTWKEKIGISSSTQKSKKPARKPLFKPNNDGFWIGGGLLGIAMLLTLINFPSLALLFGLVSLLFFIFAIKKAVRRSRRRQRFRSKRSN